MYSDVSITDFDSDDEDVVWSAKQVSDSDQQTLTGSVSDGRNVSTQSSHVYEFGDFEDNHGWIQCPSKSYPDRVYFHNTNSGCNTWYRPLSRYADIPFVSVGRCTKSFQRINDDTDDASANDLDLMEVSENESNDENESNVSTVASNRDRSCLEASDVMARCYYTPQMDLTCDTDESCRSVDAFASECVDKKEQIDVHDDNNNIDDDANETTYSPHGLRVTDFLETEFFVGESDVDTERQTRILKSSKDDSSTTSESPPRPRYIVYRVPRLKKISFEDQLIKPRRTYTIKTQGPKKIICEMYGVRTINYDLPEPDQVQIKTEVLGVKSSTLSESDSDTTSKDSPSRHAKTTQLFESEWRDIEKNLHQPLLSDSSSSPSSRSDTSNSNTSSSNNSTCSCSTCSSRS